MNHFCRFPKPFSPAIRLYTALASVVFLLGCAFAGVDTQMKEDTFTVGTSAQLVTTTENGSIRVESTGSPGAAVRVVATINNPDRVEYTAVQDGDTVRLTGKVDNGFSLFGRRSGGVDIVVTVPPNIDLDLKSSNGEIIVGGVNGSVSVETSNGPVSIADVTGDMRAKTSNGKISMTNVGGQVEAQTSNGSIDFRGTFPPGSENTLRTSNGRIEVELVDTSGVEISASTSNGRVSSSIPVTITGAAEDNRLVGTIGGGGSSLEIHTSNGSIAIK